MSKDDAAVLEQSGADDDWGAAMAEQAGQSAPSAPSAPAADFAPAGALASGSAAPAQVSQVFGSLAPGTLPQTAGQRGGGGAAHPNDINIILDIPVHLTVELGRTRIPIKQILQLAQGSVIELDGLAGEPMDVLINGCLIAQGEVVVVNEKFGIRLTDIITPSERIRKLNR